MKIKELIAELSKLPQDNRVLRVEDTDLDCWHIFFNEYDENDVFDEDEDDDEDEYCDVCGEPKEDWG